VEIVDDGEEAAAGLGEIVGAGGGIDECVGGVAGTFEGDGDLGVVGTEVADRAGDLGRLAQEFDDAEFVGGGSAVLVEERGGDGAGRTGRWRS
jgi:hypothetical protein